MRYQRQPPPRGLRRHSNVAYGRYNYLRYRRPARQRPHLARTIDLRRPTIPIPDFTLLAYLRLARVFLSTRQSSRRPIDPRLYSASSKQQQQQQETRPRCPSRSSPSSS